MQLYYIFICNLYYILYYVLVEDVHRTPTTCGFVGAMHHLQQAHSINTVSKPPTMRAIKTPTPEELIVYEHMCMEVSKYVGG